MTKFNSNSLELDYGQPQVLLLKDESDIVKVEPVDRTCKDPAAVFVQVFTETESLRSGFFGSHPASLEPDVRKSFVPNKAHTSLVQTPASSDADKDHLDPNNKLMITIASRREI